MSSDRKIIEKIKSYDFMNLNRSQLSLLITIMIMCIFVLAMFNIHMASQTEDEYFMEVMLDEEILEELFEEEEQVEEALPNNTRLTHMAFNETAKSNIEDPEPLKSLDELMAEANSEPSEANGPNSSDVGYDKLQELIEKRKEAQASYDEKTNNTLKQVNTTNRNASVSYSLIDRTHINLPIPIYTCETFGEIVVNIRVNNYGEVIDAQINTASSTSTNGCLEENAIKYALRSSFDPSSKPEQIGTITYLFQGK